MTIITNCPRATKPAPIDLCCKNFDDVDGLSVPLFRSCWNMFGFSIVAIALILAGQGLSVTRTPCLPIALKPADDIFLALESLTCPPKLPSV
jgi:hypothetical protein